jgi:hypothetical protein
MSVRVLIDANVFVSSLINRKGPPAKVINAWLEGKFNCIISIPLLEEIANILATPRIRTKYLISTEEIDKFLQLITWPSQKVNLSGKFKLCRHPSDDLILETAVIGQVKYLVTRDDDIKRDLILIRRMQSNGVTVVTVRAFLELLRRDAL